MDDTIFVCCKSTRLLKVSKMTTEIILQIFSRFKMSPTAKPCESPNSRRSCDGPESSSQRKV